ncbi:MAG TPA: hypothetical protein VLE23_07525 [Geminicoccaceae bacterium]|nr:hypothetical protein [Geminicoccaceae bacterium]
MGNWRWLAIGCALLLGASVAPDVEAASQADLKRLDNMALLLGRAAGCNLDTERATGVVGAWFDQTFPPGSIDQKRYLPKFTKEIRRHAAEQQSGNSPDSCADIAEAFRTMRW